MNRRIALLIVAAIVVIGALGTGSAARSAVQSPLDRRSDSFAAEKLKPLETASLRATEHAAARSRAVVGESQARRRNRNGACSTMATKPV
jgi:hypothetical protein